MTTKTFTADGIIFAINPYIFTVDADVLNPRDAKTFTIDGYITAVSITYNIPYGFWLNNTLLKTPIDFKKEYVYRRADSLTMSGKSVRDFSGLKQKYVLTFKNLTPDQALNITKLMIQNEVIMTFTVNMRDTVIITTRVIPYLGSITYQTLGGSYLADATIDLIDVGPS